MDTGIILSTANRDSETLVLELGPYHYLHNIVEQTPNGVMVVDTEHCVIHANPAASKFLGAKYGELEGVRLDSLLEDRNAVLFYLVKDNLKKNGLSESWQICREIEFQRENQRNILNGVVVFNSATPTYYLVYLIDITQQRKLERELRRSNAFFFNLIDSSVDSIIASDMEGNIILFNQAAQNLLGYSERDVKELHVTGLYSDGVAYELISRMRSSEFGGRGRLLRHDLQVRHRDGHDIPVSFSGGIIYDRQEEYATFGLFTDLRTLQKIEENLEQTHRMLQQSEKMAGLGRLAAGVAHEINNPMSGIMLYANLIMEELGEEHALGEDLQTIIHEAERCKVIVADLLEFSHQTSYEMELVDLNEIVQKTLTILQHQPLFHNMEIVKNLAPELPEIYGNPIRLHQVVMNIIVNGAQAMEGKGRLTITSRTRGNQDINELIVTDNGPGIEQELLEKIFDPFFTTKDTGEGTGLGLSVSYAIVKEHKGSIRVDSSPESGTVFTVKFPVALDTKSGENHE